MPDKKLLLGQSKISVQAVAALLVLALAGALGNHFTLGLFPGVEILFGSIALLIAARTLGLFWALAVGAVSIIPLIAVSHHPFGPLLYGGEAVALSFACQYSRRNIVALDGIYWLLIGMPATWLLNYWAGGGDSGMATYYALRNGVNGIGNALAAYLVIQLPTVLCWSSHNGQKISLRQAIFTLLVASALMPTLVLTALGIRHQQGMIEANIGRELKFLSGELVRALGAHSDPEEMVKGLKARDRHGETALTVLDRAGRIIAASRGDLVPGQVYVHEGNIRFDPISSLDGESQAPRMIAADVIYREGFYYERATPLPGNSGLILLVEISAKPYQKAMRQVFIGNLLSVLGFIALSFLLGRLVSNKLADPLARLAAVSTNLKWKVLEGESVHLPGSPIVEINTLVANFGDMAIGLEKSFRELSHSHEALERGINERTHELHEINRQLEVEIAERKQFEEKLAERALTLEETMEELEAQKFALDQHSIVAITDPAGKIVYANDRFCEVSQYSREELLGQDHRLLNSGYHPHEFFNRMWATIARGEVWRGEIRNRKKDGSFYWVDTTIVPFLDAARKPYQYVVIRTDITASKRAGQELLRAKEEAEQANRAKSEFLSRMSHELRTPLNAILGFAQLMEYEPLSPSQSASVKHIIRAGWHQLALVNEVLDLARIEAGRMQLHRERVMLAQAVQECIDLVSPLSSERRLKIENHVPACGECFVWADPTRLKQVLINLLSNAIKYNREGGTITLTCQHSAPGRQRVSVTDTGPGIPADKLDELFVPFNRLDADKSQIQGTGVGLAVAKRLVELMGGEIGVESRLDEGSTFWLDLPEHGSDDVTTGLSPLAACRA